MKFPGVILVLALLFAVAPAPAHGGQSMMELKQTARRDFEKADADLNVVYKDIVSQLSPKGAAALRESQRAWVIFRDKTAEAYGTHEEGGSLEGLMAIRCLEATTQNRTGELKKLFLCDQYPY